ncbi:MAG: nucleotide pyrophosphohydrolase [Alphaproteobacteria bacterium]|nr:nucleotide pyrophosphohydrolase [Alphaproteobacteria bacterium]
MPQYQTDLENLTGKLLAFRDARDWKQFHSLKNLILSLNLEASELLELTQWKTDEEVERAIGSEEFSQKAGEECADILLYLLLIAERAGLDLIAAADAKINKNAQKYPVEKSKGNARKYTEL